MVTDTHLEMKHVLGVELRNDPSRDARFTIVQLPRELYEYPPGSDAWYRESLNRHLNTEMESLEIAAQSLADFQDAPWELRLQHARQCWDESRHAQLVERQLVAQGGRAGEFPVINYDWGVACALKTLAARLTVQNRTVEAGEMDLIQELRNTWRLAGNDETAEVMDGILADEVQHVRFANEWIKREIKQNPRVVMEIAAAIEYVRKVTAAFTPAPDDKNRAGVKMSDLDRNGFAINTEDRRLAGFGDEDLAALRS
jgi:uncharacterized ferritin-like protein (DUF455 family)